MTIFLILIIAAITYTVYFRSAPMKIVYGGVGFLIIGVVLFIVFSIAISNVGTVAPPGAEELALTSLFSTPIAVLAGIIMLIIGFVLKQRKNAGK